jgi:hypothetical protein
MLRRTPATMCELLGAPFSALIASANTHKDKVKQEEKLDGKYLLNTSDKSLTAEDIALGYKQLLRKSKISNQPLNFVGTTPFRMDSCIS